MTDSSGSGNTAQIDPTDPATARVDVQDPLPETDWFWRRLYTFLFTLLSVAFIWYGLASLQQLGQAEMIYRVTRYMIGVHVMLITYYMVAPSAEQIIKIIQSAKIIRAGIPITRAVAAETPQGGRVEAKTVAGAPEALSPPPTPPAAPEPSEEDYAPRSRT